MKKNIPLKIVKKIENLLIKKSKRLHDPIFIGNEIKYLKNCIQSGFVSSVGNYVNKLEKKLCQVTGSKYSVATSSGTAALHLALHYLNIGRNDEVLLPSFTYVATGNSIKYCNATPNFLDIEKNNLGICPIKLQNYLKKIAIKRGNFTINKITKKKIKALIVVHVYGFPSKIDKIKKICKNYNIILIEDAAEAVGSKFKDQHVGTFGEIGILSFNGNKTITTGSGGAILCKTGKVYNSLKHLSTQAKLKKEFDHFHDKVGFNYRMNNLSAAVGFAQLENLSKIINAKRKNFKKYFHLLKDHSDYKIHKEPSATKSNYWLIVLKCKNTKLKKKLIKEFKARAIGIRFTWRPLHYLKIFNNCPRDNLKNSEDIFKRTLTLPSSPIISIKS